MLIFVALIQKYVELKQKKYVKASYEVHVIVWLTLCVAYDWLDTY